MTSLEASLAHALSDPKAGLEELDRLDAEDSLSCFIRQAWHVLEPATPLLWNWHLDVICAYLEALHEGRIYPRRLVLNVPPGSMKSLAVSVFYPAWVWARSDQGANESFLNITNESGLGTRDTMRMRWLVASEWYQKRWGHRVELASDQREKTHIANTKHGFRMGLGITSSVTGKRVTNLILDDPHDAKRALGDAEVQSVCQSYDQAVSSRLSNPRAGSIVLIMQRLRTNDLTGHLISKSAARWTHVKIPMEYSGSPGYDPVKDLGAEIGTPLIDPRTEVGEPLMPSRFDADFVAEQKENLGEYGWAGQMQQEPVPLGGGVIKSKWWRIWPDDTALPTVQHVFTSWDTAYTERDYEQGSYSAMTAWGVFWHEQRARHCLLLLASWHGRVGYPELRARVKIEEEKRDPDAHLIERKASGQSLLQDLQRGRVKVRGYDPRPDGDKLGRAALASSLFEGGLIYAPNRPWAHQVIDFVSQIPTGAPPSGDIGDTVTQAVRYLAKGWWVQHPDDDDTIAESIPAHEDDDDLDVPREKDLGIYG